MSIVSRFLLRTGRTQSITAALIGAVLGSCLGFCLLLISVERPPVVVHAAYELDGMVMRGGHIDLVFDMDRQRDCPAETSRWLWTWVNLNGKRVKQYFPLINSSTTLTDVGNHQNFILSIPLPSGIWEGSWYYFAKTVEHCSFLPNFLRSPAQETPDIPIRITNIDPNRQVFGSLTFPK